MSQKMGGGIFSGHLFLIAFSGHPYLCDTGDVREWERQLANIDFLLFLEVLKKVVIRATCSMIFFSNVIFLKFSNNFSNFFYLIFIELQFS